MKARFDLCLSLALVAACHSGAGSSDMPQANAGAANAGGDNGKSGAGGTPASSTPGVFDLACTAPTLGKPVLRLLTQDQFTHTVNDIFPQINGAWIGTLPAAPVSAYGFDNDAAAVVGPQLAQALLDTAGSIASALVGSALASVLPCSASAPDRSCAEQFVSQYGKRLFRRSLTQAEHDRYLSFFDGALAKTDFKSALKWTIVGLIQSPSAVYRSEVGSVASSGRQLAPTELATELSYTFTGSTPSEALVVQAESGAPLDLPALAKSLFATDAGKANLQHFFESYLGYSRVASIDRAGIPAFGAVRGLMVQETRSFIDQIVFQNGGGLKELLTSSTSNPSQPLAAYYGFPAPPSDNASVQRPSGQGIGLLAQGSILSSRAQPNGSSPTQRGLLVFSRLLCNLKPTPPPNVPGIPSPSPGVVTTRQRYESQHAVNAPCNTCHTLFDPIGFGFEHFDEGGRYREQENGLAIDSASQVPTLGGAPLFQFQGQETLAAGLAEQDIVYQCFAAYLATYAFGSGSACLGSSRVVDLRSGSLGIADFYAALAAEPHFSRRDSQ